MKAKFAYLSGITLFFLISGLAFYHFNFRVPSSGPGLPVADSPKKAVPERLIEQQRALEGQPRDTNQLKGTLTRKEYEQFISILIHNLLSRSETRTGAAPPRNRSSRTDPNQSNLAEIIPVPLRTERPEIQDLYRSMLAELRRWTQYRYQNYGGLLDGRAEPIPFDTRDLDFQNPENAQYFSELETALELHRRIVRDVRIFNEEVAFTRESGRQNGYEPYDLKFKLGPFARESAIADALQQAMSAVTSGVDPQEASEVINRLVNEFTKPVRRITDPDSPNDTNDSAVSDQYNFNIYILYGKKILRYANLLSDQVMISTTPSGRAELDFINRELIQSFQDLYEAGQNEIVSSKQLDLKNLDSY